MRFFKYLPIIYILFEITLFILVGRLIGVFPTLLLIVGTSLLGFIVLRNQGLHATYRMMQGMQSRGVFMASSSLQGLVMLAGILLILPGFLTDLVGLVLLVPAVRRWIEAWAVAKGMLVANGLSASNDATIIEGEYHREVHHLDDDSLR